jgi:Zn-dependent protease with chaperone function
MNKSGRRNFHFWGLVLLAALLAKLGTAVVGYGYTTQWAQTLWHVCKDGLENLWGHAPVSWQFVMLALLLLVLLRGLWSFSRQVWQTYRFAHAFLPLQTEPPRRLTNLLKAHYLTATDVVCLDLTAVHAFCLGFWQPRIWLTTGLLDALTDDELNAVLAHEAHHLHRRDPLRLAIGRTIGNAFFFLPLMASLAHQSELAQELDADRAAIAYIGDDLPLLRALQKLLVRQSGPQISLPVTITALNVTEARLRQLIHPAASSRATGRGNWRQWCANLGVLLLLTTLSYLAVQPVMDHAPLDSCTGEDMVPSLQSKLPLKDWPVTTTFNIH